MARVVCGIMDPDPRVAGRGLSHLRDAGLAVTTGVLADAASWVTVGHVLRVSERRPFVQLKIAVDQAGDVPRGSAGLPTWATGPEARARGHLLRAEADAILVGSGTVAADNPSLDCRLPGLAGQSPLRIVLSRSVAFPLNSRLFAPDAPAGVLVITGSGVDEKLRLALSHAGADCAEVGVVDGRLWIPAVLEHLVARGITRLLVEGGPSTWHAFDRAGMVDEVVLFRAGRGHEATCDMQGPLATLHRYVNRVALAPIARTVAGDDDMIIFRKSSK